MVADGGRHVLRALALLTATSLGMGLVPSTTPTPHLIPRAVAVTGSGGWEQGLTSSTCTIQCLRSTAEIPVAEIQTLITYG